MKQYLFICFFSLVPVLGYGQINMNDSTVQVIGYWDKNEKQTYSITQTKFKIKGADTTARQVQKYMVDVTVVDSTANSYTIDWFYHDYKIKTQNPILQKLASISENITVKIKTDEFGTIQKVLNWEEVRDYIHKAIGKLQQDFRNIPNIANLIKQIENQYNSEESIASGAIQEIQQFYTYHGGKYKLGEVVEAPMKTPNLYGGAPFDSNMTLYLDEIDQENDNSVIRLKQITNSEQLTKAAVEYLTKMANSMNVPPPNPTDIPPLKNEISTASRIHNSGWIIYSVQTKNVSTDNTTNIEERTIEIQ